MKYTKCSYLQTGSVWQLSGCGYIVMVELCFDHTPFHPISLYKPLELPKLACLVPVSAIACFSRLPGLAMAR